MRFLRFLTGSLLVGLLLTLAPGTTLAQTATAVDIEQVADELAVRGYYLDPDRPEDFAVFEQLGLGPDSGNYVAVLTEVPDGGADLFADELRTYFDTEVTVLVVAGTERGASEVGAVTDLADIPLDDALDAAVAAAAGGGDAAAVTTAFFGTYSDIAAPTEADDAAGEGTDDESNGTADDPSGTGADTDDTTDDGDGGGGGGIWIFLLVVVVGIVGVVWFVKSRASRHDRDELARAKSELKAQLSSVASEIVADEDRVALSDSQEAQDLFREANTTYTAVSEQLDTVDNLHVLAELTDRVAMARWQLDAAEALMEGRPKPPKPEPSAPPMCFFDPTHRPATEAATIKTSAGSREVRVCTACAAQLARGERPEPRMIDVGGKRVPAATAPKSHGGLGMGGLSVFEIILGALGALGAGGAGSGGDRLGGGGLDIDWTGQLPSRRPRMDGTPRPSPDTGGTGSSGGGPFGPDTVPGRPPMLPRTRTSRRPRFDKGRAAQRGRRRI